MSGLDRARPRLQPVNVLVVGGSQFNGFALVQELVRQDHRVTVLNRGRTNVDFPEGVRRLLGDRTDVTQMQELLASEEFDCIHDMCAYHPSDVEMMTELFAGRTGHYVFISSIAIYASSRILPISEDFPVERGPEQNEYGLHKLLCEDHLLLQHADNGFPATTVVLPMVMGPRNILPDREQKMFARLLSGRPILIPGDGTAVGQVGYVDDHAEALCMIMGRPQTFGQRYNLTGAQCFTDEGYVDVFAAVTGTAADKKFIPADVMNRLWDGEIEASRGRPSTAHVDIRASEPATDARSAAMQKWQLATLIEKAQPNLHRWNQNLTLSIDKAARDTGWRPRHSFHQAVERTFDWFQQDQIAQQTAFDFTFEDAILELVQHHRA
jgi:nucleoside-diphosphate-sugar epimerase